MSDTLSDEGTTTTTPAVGPTTADGLRGVFALDEGKVQTHLDRVVRETVEQTLNASTSPTSR